MPGALGQGGVQRLHSCLEVLQWGLSARRHSANLRLGLGSGHWLCETSTLGMVAKCLKSLVPDVGTGPATVFGMASRDGPESQQTKPDIINIYYIKTGVLYATTKQTTRELDTPLAYS